MLFGLKRNLYRFQCTVLGTRQNESTIGPTKTEKALCRRNESKRTFEYQKELYFAISFYKKYVYEVFKTL